MNVRVLPGRTPRSSARGRCGAPLVTGVMRQVRAGLEGRAGGGLLQPWRDLRKLFGKQPITPEGTSWCSRRHRCRWPPPPSLIAAVAPVGRHRVTAGPGRRPVRGRRPAGPGHGRACAGRHRHRHVVRRHGRQPGDHHRRPGRAHDPAGRVRVVHPGRFGQSRRARGHHAAAPGAGGRRWPGCWPSSRWSSSSSPRPGGCRSTTRPPTSS